MGFFSLVIFWKKGQQRQQYKIKVLWLSGLADIQAKYALAALSQDWGVLFQRGIFWPVKCKQDRLFTPCHKSIPAQKKIELQVSMLSPPCQLIGEFFEVEDDFCLAK